LTHKINHLSFGQEDEFKIVKSLFNQNQDTLSPLDGRRKETGTETKKIYEYYLKVVPTTFIDLNKNTYEVHQFTTNDNEYNSQMLLPAIFFRYDLSAITVKNEQVKESAFHFFVQICAIIGGVFTVVGILHSLANKFLTNLFGLFGGK